MRISPFNSEPFTDAEYYMMPLVKYYSDNSSELDVSINLSKEFKSEQQ